MKTGEPSRFQRFAPALPRAPRGFRDAGQSLIETALLVPFLVVLVFNAVNFGYVFLTAINLAAAPRSGALYSIMGGSTPSCMALPPPGPVSSLTYLDLSGALPATANSPLEVCSQSEGVSGLGAAQVANCASYGAAANFPPPPPDPEAPAFVLNRVTIVYQFQPLFPSVWFNLGLLPMPACAVSGGNLSCTFRRRALMRAMN